MFKRITCGLLILSLLCSFMVLPTSAQSGEIAPIAPDQYWGRTNLATLTNGKALVYAYEAIVKGVENSETNITVSSPVYNYYLTVDQFKVVLNAYLRDYPQHFWLDLVTEGYTMSISGGKVISFHPSYLISGSQLTSARTQFDSAVAQILSGITSDMTEFQREKYIHDTLAKRITYGSKSIHSHNAYGALVEGVSVCEGYTESFQYLLYQAGILSTGVTGVGYSSQSTIPEPHAWNLVRIDGDFYYVDLTWNDQDVTFYTYFNITTDDLLRDHQLDELAYNYPVCTATKANYFKMFGGEIRTFSTDEIVAGFHRDGYTTQFRVMDDAIDFIGLFRQNGSEIVKKLNTIGGISYSINYMLDVYAVTINGLRRGDCNNDQQINATDLTVLANHILGKTAITDANLLKAADVNQDGTVDLQDHQRLYEHLEQICTISPTGEGRPSQSNKQVVIQATPVTETLSTQAGTINAVFSLSVTPPAQEQIKILAITIGSSQGATIKNISINNTLLSRFTLVEQKGNTLYLSGCKEPITSVTALGEVTLQIADGTLEQSYVPTISNALCATINQQYTVEFIPTSVIIKGESQPSPTVLYCDVTGNEKISAEDALWVLQAVVGKRTLDAQQLLAADVTFDGAVTATDALTILKVVVGKHTITP